MAVAAWIVSRLFAWRIIAELLHAVVLAVVSLMSVSALDIVVSLLVSLIPIRLHSDISDVMHACELQIFGL